MQLDAQHEFSTQFKGTDELIAADESKVRIGVGLGAVCSQPIVGKRAGGAVSRLHGRLRLCKVKVVYGHAHLGVPYLLEKTGLALHIEAVDAGFGGKVEPEKLLDF